MPHTPSSRRPWLFPVKRIEDRHRFSTLAVCHVKGAKPRAAFRSGRLAATADQVRQGGDERLACHVEPAAQVIPERDALLGTGLGQTEKSIAAIASDLAAGAGTDLAAGDVAADVVLGAIGVQRDLRLLQ